MSLESSDNDTEMTIDKAEIEVSRIFVNQNQSVEILLNDFDSDSESYSLE